MYGHVHQMAEAVSAGAREVPGVEVELYHVPELVPAVILEKSGAMTTRATFAHVPIATVEHLAEPDAIIFGTPTRLGNMGCKKRNCVNHSAVRSPRCQP